MTSTLRALLFGAPLLTGCFAAGGASPHARPMVLVSASGDLDCPQKDIRVSQGVGGKFTAYGCGHSVVYNTACAGIQCSVAPEGESLPWRARPDPGDLEPRP